MQIVEIWINRLWVSKIMQDDGNYSTVTLDTPDYCRKRYKRSIWIPANNYNSAKQNLEYWHSDILPFGGNHAE